MTGGNMLVGHVNDADDHDDQCQFDEGDHIYNLRC